MNKIKNKKQKKNAFVSCSEMASTQNSYFPCSSGDSQGPLLGGHHTQLSQDVSAAAQP